MKNGDYLQGHFTRLKNITSFKRRQIVAKSGNSGTMHGGPSSEEHPNTGCVGEKGAVSFARDRKTS